MMFNGQVAGNGGGVHDEIAAVDAAAELRLGLRPAPQHQPVRRYALSSHYIYNNIIAHNNIGSTATHI